MKNRPTPEIMPLVEKKVFRCEKCGSDLLFWLPCERCGGHFHCDGCQNTFILRADGMWLLNLETDRLVKVKQ
jgi:hypothetical protein